MNEFESGVGLHTSPLWVVSQIYISSNCVLWIVNWASVPPFSETALLAVENTLLVFISTSRCLFNWGVLGNRHQGWENIQSKFLSKLVSFFYSPKWYIFSTMQIPSESKYNEQCRFLPLWKSCFSFHLGSSPICANKSHDGGVISGLHCDILTQSQDQIIAHHSDNHKLWLLCWHWQRWWWQSGEEHEYQKNKIDCKHMSVFRV